MLLIRVWDERKRVEECTVKICVTCKLSFGILIIC